MRAENVKIWNWTGRNTEARAVDIGRLTLYFSYKTVIAFRFKGKLYISENVWSATTGRHLNKISRDKEIRIPHQEFLDQLSQIKIVANGAIQENQEFKHLKNNAIQACVFRGHEMRDWSDYPDQVSTASCKNCNAGVIVKLNPLPNEIKIGGRAVAIHCGD